MTERFGPVRPARAKKDKLAIQETEFEPDDAMLKDEHRRTRVNPTRMWTTKVAEAKGLPPVVQIWCQGGEAPLEGRLVSQLNFNVGHKWTLSANGTLYIGESKPVDPATGQRSKQGHPTLVGGRVVPEARFGGVLHYNEDEKEESKKFVIDNDSGRFSEHSDLTPEHLANVAQVFKEAGLEVGTQWKNMSKQHDVNDTVV